MVLLTRRVKRPKCNPDASRNWDCAQGELEQPFRPRLGRGLLDTLNLHRRLLHLIDEKRRRRGQMKDHRSHLVS